MSNPPAPWDSSEPDPKTPVPDPNEPMNKKVTPSETAKEVCEALDAVSQAQVRYWKAAWRQGWSAGYREGRLVSEVQNRIQIDEANSTPLPEANVTRVEG